MINKFHFVCQKVIPLIYDDSLSYYEVLCKVRVKLNEVIENENSLIENMDDLKTFVNDFVEATNNNYDTFTTNINNNFKNLQTSFNNLNEEFNKTLEEVYEFTNKQLEQYTRQELERLVTSEAFSPMLEKMVKDYIDKISLIIEMRLPYVTPQMFGAKADGVTDDTNAIKEALRVSDYVVFPKGIYLVSSPIIVECNNRFYETKGYTGKTLKGDAGTKIVTVNNSPCFIVRGYHNLIDNFVLTFSNTIYSTFTSPLLQLESLNVNTIKQCCNNVFNNIRCVTTTNVSTINGKFSGVGIYIVSDGSNATYQNKFTNCNVADLYKGLVIENNSTEGTNANYFHIDLWNCNYLFYGNGGGNIFTGNYQAGKKLLDEENVCFYVKGSQNTFNGYVYDTGNFNRTEAQCPWLYITGINNVFETPIIYKNIGGNLRQNHFKPFTTPVYNDNKTVYGNRVVTECIGGVPISVAPYVNSLQNSLVTDITMETENVTLWGCEAVYTEKDENGIPTNIAPLVSNVANKQITLNVVNGSKIRLKFTMPNYSKLDNLTLYLNNRRNVPSVTLRIYKGGYGSSTVDEEVYDFTSAVGSGLNALHFAPKFRNLDTYNCVELELSFSSSGMFGMSYLSGVIINDLYGPLLNDK